MTSKGRNIIVIGTSAGGLEALDALIGQLPTDLPASVFVVQHHQCGQIRRSGQANHHQGEGLNLGGTDVRAQLWIGDSAGRSTSHI